MPDWRFSADYFQACNCDFGCPCEFQAPPTRGFCEGTGAWRIKQGSYGDLTLDGLSLGFVARWPQAIHQGNGTVCPFVDERATAEQRDALLQILSGQAGGIPFAVLATTFSSMQDPRFVAFGYAGEGNTSQVRLGELAEMRFGPIRNPVTGEAEGVRIEHATGFIFKSAEVLNAVECESRVPGIPFSWPEKAGFVTTVEYHN